MLHIGAGHYNSCQIILKLFRYDIFHNNLNLYGDFKRIITNAKFVPCIIHCVLLFEFE